MKEDNLDALVVSRNLHVFYMTGSRFAADVLDVRLSIVPQSCAVITQDADIYSKRFVTWDSDDIAIHTTLSDSFELYDDELELVNILSDYGIHRGQRIGIEWGPRWSCTGINPLKFQKLQELTQKELGAEFVDATDTILRVMAIKSKLEIERMKVAVSAAARAMERALDRIEIGMNQLDVARMASIYMLEAGADEVGHAQVMTGEDGANLLSCGPVDGKLAKGYHF
jgi:Xaa-Pro aminopeptidase